MTRTKTTPTKKYRLEVDPRILELLGPNLYTNIYYVLAELIANAYDADAKNVYIIAGKDNIRVEEEPIICRRRTRVVLQSNVEGTLVDQDQDGL